MVGRWALLTLPGVKLTRALLVWMFPVVLAGCPRASVEEREVESPPAPPARAPDVVCSFVRSPRSRQPSEPAVLAEPAGEAQGQSLSVVSGFHGCFETELCKNSYTEKFPCQFVL